MNERMQTRRAEPSDLDRIVEIHASAFPDPRGYAERRYNFSENPWAPHSELRVVVKDERVIAHAFLFPMQAWFGGVRVPCAGIASVGVAPEARGTGAAGFLLQVLHEEAKARGDALSILYPFRQAFYAKHGYAPTSSVRRLRFHPASIPWRTHGAGPIDSNEVIALYERAAARHTGWLVRPPALWERRLLDERRSWHMVDGGYVCWSLVQSEAHARIRMIVHDLVADDDGARRRLLALIGAQRDQVHEVEMMVADEDPLAFALQDADRDRHGTEEVEHEIGQVMTGPMVRILDLPRAVLSRGYFGDGAIAIESVAIDVRQGRAHPTASAPRVDLAAPASVLFGGMSVRAAAALGLATGDLATAERVLSLPSYFPLDPF
jgi:predicted acetyltransferase